MSPGADPANEMDCEPETTDSMSLNPSTRFQATVEDADDSSDDEVLNTTDCVYERTNSMNIKTSPSVLAIPTSKPISESTHTLLASGTTTPTPTKLEDPPRYPDDEAILSCKNRLSELQKRAKGLQAERQNHERDMGRHEVAIQTANDEVKKRINEKKALSQKRKALDDEIRLKGKDIKRFKAETESHEDKLLASSRALDDTQNKINQVHSEKFDVELDLQERERVVELNRTFIDPVMRELANRFYKGMNGEIDQQCENEAFVEVVQDLSEEGGSLEDLNVLEEQLVEIEEALEGQRTKTNSAEEGDKVTTSSDYPKTTAIKSEADVKSDFDGDTPMSAEEMKELLGSIRNQWARLRRTMQFVAGKRKVGEGGVVKDEQDEKVDEKIKVVKDEE